MGQTVSHYRTLRKIGGGGTTSLWCQGLCQAVGMAEKRTKADKLERQTEQLGKKVDRQPDEFEKELSTLAPKSDEPTVLIPIEQQIQQRAYELYERRGRTDGHDLDKLASSRVRDKGHARERGSGVASSSPARSPVGGPVPHINRSAPPEASTV